MKLFQECDLKTVFLKKEEELKIYINKFSKDEIMANDLEVLGDNCYQKFFIEPIVIFDEDHSKRNIIQGSFKKYIDPLWRNNIGREYINVDGVKIEFHFPFSGEPKLFKCYASTYTLSPYPEVSIYLNEIIFEYWYTYEESKDENFEDTVNKRREKDLESINEGVHYITFVNI